MRDLRGHLPVARPRTAASLPAAAGRVARLRRWLRHHSAAVTITGSLVVGGALVVGLWGKRADFAVALGLAPVWILAAAILLHVVWLVARSEAWHVCVGAAGGSVSRRRLYRAASLGYLGNTFNGQFGLAVRIAALRRSAPVDSPAPSVLVAAELPIVVVEVSLAALTSFTLVGPLGVPWWVPLLCFAFGLAVIGGLTRVARDRREGFWKGFAVMRDLQGRSSIIGLVVFAVCAQIARNWLVLQGIGVDSLRSGRDCAADRGGGDRVASGGPESRRGRRGGHPRGERRCRDRCRRSSADGHRRPRRRLLRLLGAGRSPSAVLRGAAACNRSRPENDRRRTSAPRGPATSKGGQPFSRRVRKGHPRRFDRNSTAPSRRVPAHRGGKPVACPSWLLRWLGNRPGHIAWQIVPALAVVAVLHPPRSQHISAEEQYMPTGTVKWFSDEKGFGFITPDDGSKDLFVHQSGIVGDGFRSLAEGAKVTYEAEASDKGPRAVNVQAS